MENQRRKRLRIYKRAQNEFDMKRELEVKKTMACSNRSFIFCVAFKCAFLFGTQALILKHHPNYTDIISAVRKALPNDSFEFYDFKVGSYNKLVDPKIHLNYHENTSALSIFMIPRVFEESFVPYLCETGPCAFNNSWTKFTKYYMTKVQMKLWEELSYYIPDKDILYPHHMLGPRHPTILVQTAGHVAGAAYYYQRKDITDDPWPKNKNINGVSIYPVYGGWFYMGPVIILEGVTCPMQRESKPKDALVDEAKKIELLNLFNGEWPSQKWRDIICVLKKYTEKIHGVSIHPLYGGWFYMGPVIILEGVTCPSRKGNGPKDVLVDETKKIELLNLFNGERQNQKWRDIICVTKNYTEEYLEYRMTYGDGRTKWVTKYYDEHCPKGQEKE